MSDITVKNVPIEVNFVEFKSLWELRPHQCVNYLTHDVVESLKLTHESRKLLGCNVPERLKLQFLNAYIYYVLFGDTYKSHSYDEIPSAKYTECDVKKTFYHKEGLLHHDRLPAITIEKDGFPSREEYYQEGKLHRDGDKPAFVMYVGLTTRPSFFGFYLNGRIRENDVSEMVFHYFGNGHRVDYIYKNIDLENRQPGTVLSRDFYYSSEDDRSLCRSAKIVGRRGENIILEIGKDGHIDDPELSLLYYGGSSVKQASHM